MVTTARPARAKVPAAPPLRPRFVHEAVVAPCERGFVVDGAHQLLRLNGRSASWIVAQLIPLLDGTRPVDALEHAVPGVSPLDVRAAIASLADSGLIED